MMWASDWLYRGLGAGHTSSRDEKMQQPLLSFWLSLARGKSLSQEKAILSLVELLQLWCPLRHLQPLSIGQLDDRREGFQNLPAQLSPLFVTVVLGRVLWHEGEAHGGTSDIEIL